MSINAPRRGNLFETVKITTPQKSAFDMSFENKLTSNMGYLVPTLCKEVLPGDYLELQTSSLVRFAPTLAPILHNVDVCTYTFFVPNRLIWKNWQKFITPGDGTVTMQNAPSYVPPISPYLEPADDGLANYCKDGSLADYLGLPRNIGNATDMSISQLPFRAYQLVYDEYFRDQNLTEPVLDKETDLGDGHQGVNDEYLEKLMTLRKKCWEKDYFTSALPTAQRGPVVLLPLGNTAKLIASKIAKDLSVSEGTVRTDKAVSSNQPIVTGISDGLRGADVTVGSLNHISASVKTGQDSEGLDVYTKANLATTLTSSSTGGNILKVNGQYVEIEDVANYLNKSVKVDLSSASSATVETLRNAFKLQEFFEKSARCGARYIESILAHFGVSSSDARLQRPELLGTSRNPVVVSEIAQTSQTEGETSPTGTLYGKLTSSYHNDMIRYEAEEHGFLIQLQCVIPRTAYYQGVSRMWSNRHTYLDYAWPEFAHLGEQEVFESELYIVDNEDSGYTNDDVFGYQPRYSEYKYNSDEVHGDFKSSLAYWHLARTFSSRPTLSKEFVESDPSTRIFAVTDKNTHHLYQEIWHNFKMVRCLPEYGTPHF